MGKKQYLEGKRFGRLVVIEEDKDYVTSGGNHVRAWLCKCDCGKYTTVTTYQLNSGKTRSCGCLVLDMLHGRKTPNKYELYDDYYVGWDKKGNGFIFDVDDYDLVSQYHWFVGDRGYVLTSRLDKNGLISLHRLVMGVEDSGYPLVDHINQNKSDCRKCNLRFASQSLNQMNVSNWKSNKTGVRGVFWNSQKGKWQARINLNKKNYHLGFYDNIEDAKAARKEAEEILYKEFSYDQSQEIALQNYVLSPC